MTEETARQVARLTSNFYAQVADSFSATRSAPWGGWGRVLAEVWQGPRDAFPREGENSFAAPPEAGPNPRGVPPRPSQGPPDVPPDVPPKPSQGSPNMLPEVLPDIPPEVGECPTQPGSPDMPPDVLPDAPLKPGERPTQPGSRDVPPKPTKGSPNVPPDMLPDIPPKVGKCPTQPGNGMLRVLDLACGNLRFERYLDDAIYKGKSCSTPPDDDLMGAPSSLVGFSFAKAYAFDSCDDLAHAGELRHVAVDYRHLDIVGTLLARKDLASCLSMPPCELSVCFGFMHHLALAEHRASVLHALVDRTRPGGLVALSFWQLSQSERLLAKARATTEEARARFDLDDLGPGDYLLGWQGRSDVFRFCHDFLEDEIDLLAETVSGEAEEIARYSADGASGRLNRYLLLRRR